MSVISELNDSLRWRMAPELELDGPRESRLPQVPSGWDEDLEEWKEMKEREVFVGGGNGVKTQDSRLKTLDSRLETGEVVVAFLLPDSTPKGRGSTFIEGNAHTGTN